MLRRRDLMLGLPLVAAAAGAAALTPRERLNLRGPHKIADMVPLSFAGWHVTPSNAVVLPKPRKGSLADTLYGEQVSRLYLGENRLPVMLVIAYGDTQSDALQLHRPEVCYSAVGFAISRSRPIAVPVGAHATLPMRALTATLPDRTEPILYWTRIGDYLPTSGSEQRLMKLRTEMAGYVADGVLVRLSTVGDATDATFAALEAFARAMLAATAPEGLPALVGRPLAAALRAEHRP
jgi:EpsI family protein